MTQHPSLLELLQPPKQKAAATMRRGLVDHLIRRGDLTESGFTRNLRVRTCPSCKAATLVGLDADRAAFEARCDPHPLTPLGEMLAAIEHRRTWHVRREGGRFVLDPRDARTIEHQPAGTPRRDVLREHRCRSREPGPLEVAVSSFAEITATIPDQPQF